MHAGKNAAVIFAAALTLWAASPAPAQSTEIPNWWYSSNPQAVMNDPLFPKLPLTTRKEILSQIDPKFAKMKGEKQDAFLWNAETKYLPKATPPKATVRWNPSDTGSTSQLLDAGGISPSIAKTVRANSLVVQASLEKWAFPTAHLRITNETPEVIMITPETFVLYVMKPKQRTLSFEYPSRVSHQIIQWAIHYSPPYPTERTTIRSASGKTVATVDSPDEAAKQSLNDATALVLHGGGSLAASIEPKSLKEGPLGPGASSEGNVYFESYNDAKDLVMRVFLSNLAFEIPFTLPGRDR
jgi:hypothetical protein